MLNRDWLVANRGILLVLLLGALVLLPALSFGLWEPWEPKYAQSAVEMIERPDPTNALKVRKVRKAGTAGKPQRTGGSQDPRGDRRIRRILGRRR